MTKKEKLKREYKDAKDLRDKFLGGIIGLLFVFFTIGFSSDRLVCIELKYVLFLILLVILSILLILYHQKMTRVAKQLNGMK